MKLLLLLALATQTLVWNAKQWHAEWKPRFDKTQTRYPDGSWQSITGPAKWLIPRLDYDDQMHRWFVWEGGLLPGWGTAMARTPLRDGDVVELDEKGVVRMRETGFSRYPYRANSSREVLIGYASPAAGRTHVTMAQADSAHSPN